MIFDPAGLTIKMHLDTSVSCKFLSKTDRKLRGERRVGHHRLAGLITMHQTDDIFLLYQAFLKRKVILTRGKYWKTKL